MKRFTEFLFFAAMGFIAGKFILDGVSSFDHDLKQVQAENECVRKMIQSGYERINIETSNGTCSFKLNGYYGG